MTAKRTRLQILADTYRDFNYYFTDNFNKPFIKIGKCEIQFKNRKAAADFVEAIHFIGVCEYFGKNSRHSVKQAIKALESMV